MIKNNKVYNNIQEQVLQNMRLLEDFINGDKTIAEFGLHVIAIYDD